jgi:hypothetical protein
MTNVVEKYVTIPSMTIKGFIFFYDKHLVPMWRIKAFGSYATKTLP